ncbi:DUF3604 domain-containing protein [Sinorhizobium chiapasense]|uniref:DUF3604 domain-containing protein n=1 Tax=Sinorhizobium chiapasense TaxID=501572 RepID=A0ABZ2BCH3_9HYPH
MSSRAQERQAYFGETHVHTGWSFDAYIFGNTKTTPADAYRYAKGETIKHPLGYDIKIDTPLDWMGVTDHSEYVGTVALANTPGSDISKLPIAQKLIVHAPADVQRIYLWLGGTIVDKKPIEALISPEVAGSVWKQNIQMADQANEPGKFTAFCSYEWTSTPDNRNMHRNVFFKDCAKVPVAPYSSIDSSNPSDLWAWMDDQRKAGNELLAISHNANLSDGHMFPTDVDEKGRPIDAAWAASRDRNERLTEIKQIKGASETHPTLSPNDEFANFEILTYLLGDPAGRFPTVPGSYIRQALKDGLSMMEAQGYNPYKTGFVGGSDSHNTGVPYRQDNFFGGHGRADGDMKQRMAGRLFAGLDTRLENPAGLTGVWAEENTRASLFDAMQRKETFATSGPHIRLRFFGRTDGADVANRPDWVKAAYAGGVPMGGDLPPVEGAGAPSFIVWAVKDPTSGNLDRVQIVKGWTKHGQSFEKVHDVAWAGSRTPDQVTGVVPPIGSTVNIAEASYTNTIGSVELKGTWTDPEFDPSLDAFYYARVLEIPTPRWTTIQARDLGIAPPDNVAATIQERAWSSPIWYTPTQELRVAADNGTTVADLKQQGAVQLDNAALTDFIVGKTTWVRNNVTGAVYNIAWTTSGQRLIGNVNGAIPQPAEVGDVIHGGALGVGSAYAIKDGAIVTTLGNTPYEATVYKLDDKYFAARSNEFGYANYEVVPTPQALDPLDQQKAPF